MPMMRKLYNWTLKKSESKYALWILAALSFIESSVFPIPPDVMLVPMMIARIDRVWFYAAVCTVASVLGGIFGYFIGFYLFDTVGVSVLEFYGISEQFNHFKEIYLEWGILIVLVAGITPIPYKIVTIASGLMAMNIFMFILASIVARTVRFFIEAIVVHCFGAAAKKFIDKHLEWVAVGFTCVLLLGFFVIKILM